VGEGDGLGFNVNIAWNLPEKTGVMYLREETVGDEEYACAFRKIVMPVLREYEPELVLVSCGFDSGWGDSIGNLKVSQYGYMFMTRQLMSLKKPIGVVLEGGYNLDVLKWGSKAVVRTLTDSLTESELTQIQKLDTAEANSVGA
jgi:acetoin utilization deacetylase AcuC-like enzyme